MEFHPLLILAIIDVESDFEEAAISNKGARGLMQIKPSTLHFLAVMGGWPGALVAQRVFHHKSRQPSFQLAFLATVVANCAALIWFWWMMR